MAEVLRSDERTQTIEVDSMEKDYCEKVFSRIRKEVYWEKNGDL